MKFSAIIVLAFGALVSANCEPNSGNFMCQGMGACLDPAANCAKRSGGHGFTAAARDIAVAKVKKAE